MSEIYVIPLCKLQQYSKMKLYLETRRSLQEHPCGNLTRINALQDTARRLSVRSCTRASIVNGRKITVHREIGYLS